MPSTVLAIGWLIAIVLIFGALVYTTWWALFADRPHDRRRCPRCWHEMTYTPGLICSECGHDAVHEKRLRRTRRRTVVAIASLTASVALAAYIGDRVRARGWNGVPTAALLAIVPLTTTPGNPVASELRRRANIGRLDTSDWEAAIARAATGDRRAQPTTTEWRQKYAPILRSAKRRLTRMGPKRNAAVSESLLDTPVWLRYHVPAPWPAGDPVSAHVYAEAWWPDGVWCRITTTPIVAGAVKDVHVLIDAPIQLRSYSIELPALEPGKHEIPVEVQVERRLGADSDWEIVRNERLTVGVDVARVDGPEPVTNDELDGLIEETFRLGGVYTKGSLPVRIRIDRRTTLTTPFDGVTIGVELELWRNGRLGRRLDTWWRGGTSVTQQGNAWEVPYWDPAVLSPEPTPDDEWELRARGSRRLAIRLEGTEQYWAGDVRIPVTVDIAPPARNSPPRGWMASSDPTVMIPPAPIE